MNLTFDQIGIACTGVVAIWLSQDTRLNWRRWSCIFGLLSQPFWFYSAWKAQQWGIFGISFFYTWSWIRGFINYWWQPWRVARDLKLKVIVDLHHAIDEMWGLSKTKDGEER
jgi:hypothetical protein